VYRGRELSYDKNGNVTTENWVVKLIHGIPEWYTFLKMLRPNGYCAIKVEDVRFLNEGEWIEAGELPTISEEVEKAFAAPIEKLSPEQERIATLEAKLEEMERMLKSTYVKPKDSFSVPNKLDEANNSVSSSNANDLDDIEQLREQYLSVSKVKAHHLWKADRIKEEIAKY